MVTSDAALMFYKSLAFQTLNGVYKSNDATHGSVYHNLFQIVLAGPSQEIIHPGIPHQTPNGVTSTVTVVEVN